MQTRRRPQLTVRCSKRLQVGLCGTGPRKPAWTSSHPAVLVSPPAASSPSQLPVPPGVAACRLCRRRTT
eukprot:243584-Chlamydomonas_euryale.AAC.2